MRGAAYDFIHVAVPPTSEKLAKAWDPWFETCIEVFGPDRCVFENNLPLEKLGRALPSFGTLSSASPRLPLDNERDDLFGRTARRINRLDV